MSFLRSAPDIDVSVKKAISPEEMAPKRKHVRSCVVYSWDRKDGRGFWHAVRMLPLQGDPVMTFKALIVIHKVLHEGHKYVLREAQHHTEWIRSLANHGGGGGYRRLIDEYVKLLLHKLEFHRHHPEFNGTFEYEEYISLRSVDDPNEGYEIVIDLMNLQDTIDDYQRLVFASLGAHSRRSGSGASGMECRVSSLTAMVTESYGIYRFFTSMLRGLQQQSDPEVLAPLVQRYVSQHRRLRRSYFECRGIKYLASLITIPELEQEAPDLTQTDENAPALPKRPRELQPMNTGATTMTSMTTGDPSLAPIVPEATGNWWQGQQPNIAAQQAEEQQHLRQLEEQQRQLEMERQHQQQLVMQAQQQFEQQQAALMQQRQQQLNEYSRMQQQQVQGQQQAFEQEMSLLRQQQQEAQGMLQQYDQRVQSLESDLAQMSSLTQQQIDAKTEQIDSMQEQIDTWRQKYEALAKLYSQLRHEHLDTMAKYRKIQTKAASAQEAIELREKAERDLKSKNLELADLIRERDRARYELDKTKGQHSNEIERLERHVSLLNEKVSDNDRTRNADVSALVSSYSRQIANLESELAAKELLLSKQGGRDDEIDILKEQLAQMEEMVGGMSLNNGRASGANGSAHVMSILDTVLAAGYDKVQQALTAFDSPLENGNPNANPLLLLNICEGTMANTEQFCDAFTQYIAEGEQEGGNPIQIIMSITSLSESMGNLLHNIEGLADLTTEQKNAEMITSSARDAATSLCTFYGSLNSEFLSDLEDEDDKLELIITNHVEILKILQDLSDVLESMLPKSLLLSGSSLNQQVDGAMAALVDAVTAANKRVMTLFDNAYSMYDRKVNDAIIGAAAAITSSIGALIQSAVECQKEIVANGRQGESPENYYKKNHRWTEGIISAARTVGNATNFLIETADGTLSGKGNPEELIVSSREVASSIAQLVAAARVKAGQMSKTQQDLEGSSKNVTIACRSLVTQVEDILSKRRPDAEMIDYSKLNPIEFKSASMEQQVEVLKLEQELTLARNRLFEIRKLEYVIQENE